MYRVDCLPYQPLDLLSYSLSAADLQVVSMGDAMVGCVHPCKIYGAMALGQPVLYLGPQESHVGDILAKAKCGWQVEHGDVTGCVGVIRQAVNSEWRMANGECKKMADGGRMANGEWLMANVSSPDLKLTVFFMV